MDTRRVERVEGWQARRVPDGFRGLHDLADGSFSGAVSRGGSWLFMLNGRIIGVLGGDVDDFGDGEATAYEAPDSAVPLLFSMQERGGTTKGRYYTEETPLSEVDGTLSEGSFTGYVELSENVLSGDYYVLYYGGRSMAAAFVGASDQLLSGDEAFERAADEVGIYEVVEVDVEVTEVPEPEPAPDADGGGTAAGAAAGAAAGDGADEESADDEHGHDDAHDRTDDDPAPGEAGRGTDDGTDRRGVDDRSPADAGTGPDPGRADESETADDPGPADEPGTTVESGAEAAADDEPDVAPGPGDGEPDREPAADAGGTTDDVTTGRSDDVSRRGSTDAERPAGREPDREPADGDRPADREGDRDRSADREPDRERTDREPTTGEPDRPTDDGAGREPTPDDRSDDAATADVVADEDASPAAGDDSTGAGSEPTTAGSEQTATGDSAGNGAGPAAGEARTDEAVYNEEAQWRETRTIPSLDPEATDRPTDGGETAAAPAADRQPGTGRDDDRHGGSKPAGGRTESAGSGTESAGGRTEQAGGGQEVADLRAVVEEREDRIRELRDRLAAVESERDELADEREELTAERDELAAERDRLRADLEEAEAELADVREELASARDELQRLQERAAAGDDGGAGAADGAPAGPALSQSEALSGTNLFVRYGSKGEATLAAARDGEADRDAVEANLRLEQHTQFETDGATVEGEPYGSFLRNSLEYRFVDWLVRELPFEIREAGHRGGLADLYAAIPEMDRAQLRGTVTVDAGEAEAAAERTFDVVLRDKMGRPLVVADLSTGRSPVTADGMASLVDDATVVAEASDHLDAAFYVTASFFRPDALETASEATGGGFLSRDKRESFVRVARKQGYHLCLVEAREGSFHVTIPEL